MGNFKENEEKWKKKDENQEKCNKIKKEGVKWKFSPGKGYSHDGKKIGKSDFAAPQKKFPSYATANGSDQKCSKITVLFQRPWM